MRAVAAVTAAAALVLAGCGGAKPRPQPTPVPTPRPPSDRQRLQHALDATAAAVHVPALGVHDVAMHLEDQHVHGDRARLTAQLTYRVRGVPGTFGAERQLRAHRTAAGRWRIGRATGTRDRPPWEADRYRRLASGHFVIWFPRGIDLDGLPAALDAGYASMRTALKPGALRKRYLVVVARDPGRARAITAHIRGLGGLTALTDTQVQLAGPAERVVGVTSQRLLVLWPAFPSLTPAQQRQAVAHELTHAALAPVTSGRVPAWLTEGIALYVSGDRRQPAQRPTLRRLSGPEAIARLDGPQQSAAYDVASTAAFAIAERYGRAKLLALYDVFDRPGLRGKAGDPRLVDRALRRVLGISLAELQRRIDA